MAGKNKKQNNQLCVTGISPANYIFRRLNENQFIIEKKIKGKRRAAQRNRSKDYELNQQKKEMNPKVLVFSVEIYDKKYYALTYLDQQQNTIRHNLPSKARCLKEIKSLIDLEEKKL